MKQQSSVEWLFETMAKTPMTDWYEVLEKAKEKHKEECENAWMDGLDYGSNYKDFEDYYNQTFNQ